jgi:hypothetical protein
VTLLLLPDAKSIKVGGFEFQRAADEIKEHADKIKEHADEIRLSSLQFSQNSFQASQVTHASHAVTVVNQIGKQAVRGDSPAASLKAQDVLPQLVDPS